MRQMAERDGRHRRIHAQSGGEGRDECWRSGVHPELVVKTLHQLQGGAQPPRQLAEDLVLFVRPRECRVGSGLAVVVAQVLVSTEKPQSITRDGTTEVRREVPVPLAFVPARWHAAS